MFRFEMKKWLPLLGVLIGTAAPTKASFTSYSTRAGYEAGNPDQTFTLVTFEDAISTANYDAMNRLIRYGVTFIASLSGIEDLHVTNNCPSNSSNLCWGNGVGGASPAVAYTGQSGFVVQINLPAGVRSLGLDFMVFSGAIPLIDVNLTAAGGSYSDTIGTSANPTRTFWGLRSTTDIQSLTLSPRSGGKIAFDDVEFGTATPETPEVATLLLIGSGLVLMRLLRLPCFRRRRVSPSPQLLQT